MVWQQNNEILSGGGQNKFVSRARGDSRLLFIANLPNSCLSCWFISLSSETCLTISISFFLLNWQCELGRVRILHSRSHHLDRQTPWLPPSQMTSFVCFCHMQSKSKWIFVFCGEWARLRSWAAVLGPWWEPCAQSRPRRPPDTSYLAPSPSPTASHPRVGTGNAIAAYAARRSGDPATNPHSCTRDSLPSLWPRRGQRLRRNQCPARLLGSSAECAFPSPPFRFCSSVQRVASRHETVPRCEHGHPGDPIGGPGRRRHGRRGGALRGPRRTTDISQQVTCRPKSETIYLYHAKLC
jgi:hypothetical protein